MKDHQRRPNNKHNNIKDQPNAKKPFKKKKAKKKALPRRKRGEPAFLYYCTCHEDMRATKVPCERRMEDLAEKKFSESPLGTWRCAITNRKCKVRRVKNVSEQVPAVEEAAAA